MGTLVPEQRQDKNGHLVTRHVKADAGSNGSASSIPAPSLLTAGGYAQERERLGSGEFVAAVESRFEELGVEVPDNLNRLLLQINYSSSLCNKADEKLYDMLPEMDADDLKSLTRGVEHMRLGSSMNTYASLEAQVLSMAIMSYEWARTVDDAKFPVPYERKEDNSIFLTGVNLFAKNKRVRCTEETAADLQGQYLLEALSLNGDSFASAGDYYRGLAKLKDQQEELKPYLPLLIAMNTAFADGKGWYFNDDYYLWENIDEVKRYPVDRIEAIAMESIRRGRFDPEFAEEIAESNADTLNDGLL